MSSEPPPPPLGRLCKRSCLAILLPCTSVQIKGLEKLIGSSCQSGICCCIKDRGAFRTSLSVGAPSPEGGDSRPAGRSPVGLMFVTRKHKQGCGAGNLAVGTLRLLSTFSRHLKIQLCCTRVRENICCVIWTILLRWDFQNARRKLIYEENRVA